MRGILELTICQKCEEKKLCFDIGRSGVFHLCEDCMEKWKAFRRKEPYKTMINQSYRTPKFLPVWFKVFNAFLKEGEKVRFT